MLEVDGLSILIHGKRIVDRSTFSVPMGSLTALIGESGSGKSMTVAAILRMLPDGGEATGMIRLNGENVLECKERDILTIRRQRIFTIFQDASNSFDGSRKMGRQLYSLSAGRLGEDISMFHKKMPDIIKKLDLPADVLDRYPFELSGGMLQRCMIACALYMEPELLVADEPTSAFDRVVQREFSSWLRRLNEQHGTTILMVTHDLEMVVETAHHLIVMHEGKVVETGAVDDVLAHPKHPYTNRLLESRFL
ncbi:ABC transporter ATP-binding protein [Sporosarcina sp. Te-1]|uniref:ATP-binding cassette domain-containing protein n=1 Tax=Sporosarcina sp. Te-1 TaxID=2818390 RepID=UPI001A9F2F88|nr:ABC transporter ATP-binding protein [Sporosarcina sp. Te-1]QTD39986.1 ABC transporter ATP-binding protein [Sporosarcina sp. Te-1]